MMPPHMPASHALVGSLRMSCTCGRGPLRTKGYSQESLKVTSTGCWLLTFRWLERNARWQAM
eukprot:13824711-Alexandrium_andersonii.AAC.1